MFIVDFFKNDNFDLLSVSAAVSYMFMFFYITKKCKVESIVKKETYETKYYDKFDLLEIKELEKEYINGLKNSVLYEYTPKGRVIMYYNVENESFIYYCDTKDISYLYLETVARKYALMYDCKQLVVDIKKELKDAKNVKDGKNAVINGPTLIDNKPDVFASFKNYNKKSGAPNNGNKKYILRQKANRYSYKGKVNEFDFTKPNDYKSENDNEKMDYETFKRLMKNIKKIKDGIYI